MVICADTSFLFSLYGDDRNSSRAVAWVKSCDSFLSLSTLNEYELGNALRFAEFRKAIDPGAAALYWAHYEADLASGRLQIQLCNLAEIVDEAKRLSSTYTLKGGHRGFDMLHVAASICLNAEEFLTFDGNQKRLAEAEGLSVPL